MEQEFSVIDVFYHHTEPFLDRLMEYCSREKIDMRGFSIDHVCIRVSSDLIYLLANKEIEAYRAQLVGVKDHIIGGRKITLRKMPIPIIYEHPCLDKKQIVDILELPAPKPNHSYEDGVQHAEFYPHTPKIPLGSPQEYIESLLRKFPSVSREKDFSNKYNPTIAHSFTKDLELKIHPYPVTAVVKYESDLSSID